MSYLCNFEQATCFFSELVLILLFPEHDAVSDEKIMMLIADHFIKIFDCEKLAVHLGIPRGSDFVEALLEVNPRMPVSKVAFVVMKRSLSDSGTTVFRKRLRSALSAVADWKGILDKFNEAFKSD